MLVKWPGSRSTCCCLPDPWCHHRGCLCAAVGTVADDGLRCDWVWLQFEIKFPRNLTPEDKAALRPVLQRSM